MNRGNPTDFTAKNNRNPREISSSAKNLNKLWCIASSNAQDEGHRPGSPFRTNKVLGGAFLFTTNENHVKYSSEGFSEAFFQAATAKSRIIYTASPASDVIASGYCSGLYPLRETRHTKSCARTTSTTPQKRALPFPGPDRWKQAREYRRKVYQLPQVDPRTDLSIVRVEADADVWVSQLVDAMKNTDDVKDLQNSHHRRLFLPKKTDDLLIDACCCAIFEALIDRCRYGFRGPAQFNKALKPMHGLELDRTATCEVRIRNVVRVLRWNKRVCKDVLYEDWKIRLLVNHPLSYDKEKDNQKGSNDQRRKRQLEQVEKLKETEEKMKETEKKLKDFEDTNDPARNKDVDDACVAGFPVNGTSDVNDMLAEDMLMHETPNTYADLHGANNFDHSDFSLGKRAASSSLDANERKRQCQ
ncbi:hypothetical protein GRF29_154g351681 [Pseudopithomyces chartarum]|uniref:Uncharacterized protein n=1 Tax=Pseudopithomyces chartarum TaxID=1892770 RepID=A0AAN6LTX3_9PLEO|nr:hypothetical protein GRF29_154g351681 [Pseudopithomyces chartarum]